MDEHYDDPATVEEQRFLRRMTVVGATPTPATGGLAGRPGIDSTGLPGVYVAGDWVGPRGWLADCSLSSGEAAGSAAARTAAITNRRSSVPPAGTQERRNGADPARVVAEMLAATTAGDIDGLVRLLAEDAVLVSDGGAHKRAARHPIKGRDRLARFLANIGKRYDTAQATLEPVTLNGELGIVISVNGEREAAISFEVDSGLVHEVHIIAADDKLAALERPLDMV